MAIGPYLTTEEAAEILGVHTSRISHFVKSGRLNVATRYGMSMLFDRKEVAKFRKLPRKTGRPKESENNTRRQQNRT